MTLTIPSTGTGQTTLGHFVITTATAALLTGGAMNLNMCRASSVELARGRSIYELKDYERAMRGFDSSGSTAGLVQFNQEFSSLVGFAEKMLAEMADVPADYDKIFQENFRDILA